MEPPAETMTVGTEENPWITPSNPPQAAQLLKIPPKTAKRTVIWAVTLLVVLAAALTLPPVLLAAPDGEGQPTTSLTVHQMRCANDSVSCGACFHEQKDGLIVGQLSGRIEEGALAGLSWVSTGHPDGGPDVWSPSVTLDPQDRGLVAEFWVWAAVLSPPVDPPAGFDLPREFPLLVRLIDGGESPTSADWQQLFVGGSIPLCDPEPGYEECLLSAASVCIEGDPTR